MILVGFELRCVDLIKCLTLWPNGLTSFLSSEIVSSKPGEGICKNCPNEMYYTSFDGERPVS